jgi:thiamine-monophosphate kinase
MTGPAGPMREWDLLAHIARATADLPASFPAVEVGPGDDCAVVRPASGATMLLKVDQVVGGRHVALPEGWASDAACPGGLTRDAFLDLIARKALARTLSDIAAMGGTPTCALVGACLPAGLSADAARVLADAIHAWGRRWSCPIVGGDVATAADESTLVLSVSVLGVPHATRGPVLRRGAQPGDRVYVTGHLGGSLAPDGLGHHLTFEPRLAEARALADTLGPRLHAMMDISDGLGVDAGRLADASGVRIDLDGEAIPLTPGCDLARALRDGEDYELLFALAPDAAPPILPCPVTRIGTCAAGRGVTLRLPDGSRRDVRDQGWQHGGREDAR